MENHYDKYAELLYKIDCVSDWVYFKSGELNHRHNSKLMKKIEEYEDMVNMPENERYLYKCEHPELVQDLDEFLTFVEKDMEEYFSRIKGESDGNIKKKEILS